MKRAISGIDGLRTVLLAAGLAACVLVRADDAPPPPEAPPSVAAEPPSAPAEPAFSEAFKKSELTRLRADLAALQADRTLAAHAQGPIADAQKALKDAAAGYGNPDTALHFLYMADRKVQLARALAEGSVADEQYQQLLTQLGPAARGGEVPLPAVDTPQQEELIRNAAALKPRRENGALHFTVDNLLVLPGTVTLTDNLAQGLVALSVYLRRNQQSQLLLIGHARGNGDDEAVTRVAQSRADGVRNYLMRLGVLVEQITLETQVTNEESVCARCVEAILDPPWGDNEVK